MAPKRKQSNADGPGPVASTRVTRSSTRRANSNDKSTAAPPPAKPEPKKKKAQTAAAATEKPEVEAQPPAKEEAELEPEVLDSCKTVVIEHCKQCNSFKTRALMAKRVLEQGAPGVKVVVNPEKPRKGCFEIREEGGGIFVSLLDMKRPFKPMKDLDMDQVVSEIVEKIK